MLLRRITTLLPLLAVAQAFKNAAPFFMISSESLDGATGQIEVQTAENVDATISKYYSDAKARASGRHILVEQPGLTTSDLQSMPKLGGLASSSKLPYRLTISNVIGDLDVESLIYYMEAACGAAWTITDKSWSWTHKKAKEASLSQIRGKKLPSNENERKEALSALDTRLDTILSAFPESGAYTIVLVSKSVAQAEGRYEIDEPYQGILRQELKRDTVGIQASNKTGGNRTSDNFQDGLPLFERYAYFSPPLFMGLATGILLLIILYTAVSAIAGLEVSYAAFSKEMAPQNQKKQN